MLNTLREELEHRTKSNNERNEFRMAIAEDYFIDLMEDDADPAKAIEPKGGDMKLDASSPKGGDKMKLDASSPKGGDDMKLEDYFDEFAFEDLMEETKADANLDTWLTQDIDPDDDYEFDSADEVNYDTEFTKEVDFDDDFTSDFLTDYEPNTNLDTENDYIDDANDVFETDALEESYLFEDIDPDTDVELDSYGYTAEVDDIDGFDSDLDPDVDDDLTGMTNGSLDEFDDSTDPFTEAYLFEECDHDDDEECEECEDEDEDDELDDDLDAIDVDEDGEVITEKDSKSESFGIYEYFGLV